MLKPTEDGQPCPGAIQGAHQDTLKEHRLPSTAVRPRIRRSRASRCFASRWPSGSPALRAEARLSYALCRVRRQLRCS